MTSSTATSIVQCSSNGTARATTPAGTSPDAEPVVQRSREHGGRGAEVAADELGGPGGGGRVGQRSGERRRARERRGVLEDVEVGDVNRWLQVELRAERVDEPERRLDRVARRRLPTVEERHDDVADAVRREQAAAALRGAAATRRSSA